MARLVAAVYRVSGTVACGLFVVDQWSVHFSDVKVTEKTHKNTGHEACPSEILIQSCWAEA